jgi:hypothetical protein
VHTGVHAKLTHNPAGSLTPAQEHGAAGTFSPEDKDDQRPLPRLAAPRSEGHRDPSGVPQRAQACVMHAFPRVPELAGSESERQRRLGATGRRYELDAVPGRGEDLRRARAPQRVTNHKIDERTRPYPVGRMKGDRR